VKESKLQRQRLDSQEIEAIAFIWALDPGQTAKSVWYIFGTQRTSLRSVQLIIQKAKKMLADRPPFPTAKWKAWEDDSEDAKDTEFLLEIDQVCRLLGKTGLFSRSNLYKHEAKWGRKLRSLLKDASPFLAFYFVKHYAEREAAAYRLGVPIYTDDIDGFLVYQGWKEENAVAYGEAIELGTIPPPVSFGFGVTAVRPEGIRTLVMYGLGIPDYLPEPGAQLTDGLDGLKRYYDMLRRYSNGQEVFYYFRLWEKSNDER